MLKEEKSFMKEKKEKLAASPVEKVTKNRKIMQIHQAVLPNLHQSYTSEYTNSTQINMDFVSHPVASTTEPSTSLVRVETDACHVVRKDEDRTTKKVFRTNWHTEKWQVKVRWFDSLEKDLRVLRAKNWRTLAGRRLAWKWFLEKAKDHFALSSH
ncbi:hypothetical protein TNCV_814541 [Trichonephila clavipes]|nr:hypothetical protein TNCV_814541 [Trichonephila clavipes]